MTSRFKAMIFDMDGTLLDSMWYWRTIWREFVRDRGIDLPPELEGQTQFGCSKACEILGRQLGQTKDELFDEMMVYLNRHYQNDTVPKPRSEELLKRLREAGYAVCVATATRRGMAFAALERHGLTKYLDFVTDTEETGCSKDNPQFYKNVAERLGVKPEECVMFEDSIYAIRGAKAAGLTVCAIDEPISYPNKDAIMALADRYVMSWVELLDEKA